jgi:ABC-type transport system involved in multi-copper enzyme maturation permease subunit
MTIKEKGYVHWDGELVSKKFPWKPITRYGIRLTFKKKFFKFFFIMSFVPAVFFLAVVYVSERLEDFRFMLQDTTVLKVDPGFFESYFTNDFLLFMMVMILVFAGSGLVADDLRHNSLQLYFSRPIKKKDFFLGKISVLFFFLLLVTFIPGLILFIMKLLFSGSLRFFLSYPWLPLSIVGYSLFVTVFFSLYALLLSSLSKNRRYVSIQIFGLYIFTDILYGIFSELFESPYFSLLSIKSNIQQVGAALFKQPLEHDIPWIFSFLVLCAVGIVAAFVLNKRVRGIQVVK